MAQSHGNGYNNDPLKILTKIIINA